MKKLNRILSLVACLSMLLTAVPAPAEATMAETQSDLEKTFSAPGNRSNAMNMDFSLPSSTPQQFASSSSIPTAPLAPTELSLSITGAPATFSIPASALQPEDVVGESIPVDRYTGEDTPFVTDPAETSIEAHGNDAFKGEKSLPRTSGSGGGQAVDIVFAMDTSGSMDDEFGALCSKIEDIVNDLKARGITVRYRILGIAYNYQCTESTVPSLIPGAMANHEEDWGPAVYDLSHGYDWVPGYGRLIIPMSDEAPEDGNSCHDPGDDRAAIVEAVAAAQTNNVRVLPILGSWWDSDEAPCITLLAEDLAHGTGGRAFYSTDPSSDLAAGIVDLVGEIAPNPLKESPPTIAQSQSIRNAILRIPSADARDDEVFYGLNLPQDAYEFERALVTNYQFGGVITITIPIDRYYGETTDPNNPSPLKDDVIGKAVPEEVELTIMAYDVESLGGLGELNPDYPRSSDRIRVNGHTVGLVKGRNGQWAESILSIPTEYLNFPVFDGKERRDAINTITIAVDTLGQGWATEVAWARLKIPGVRPVLLVRGFDINKYVLSSSNETRWETWKEWVNTPDGYLYHMAPNVQSDGADAIAPIDGIESFAADAIDIRDMIDDVLDKYGVNKVNVVAHSKGGLDTRGVFQLDMDHNIDTVVTLGTPHEGVFNFILHWLLDCMGGSPYLGKATASELSEEGVAILKTRGLLYVPPDVRIVAVAGTDYRYGAKIGYLLMALGYENDGIVTVESAHNDYSVKEDLFLNHTTLRTSELTFYRVAPYLKPVELGGVSHAMSAAQITAPIVQAAKTLQSGAAEPVQVASILTGSILSGEIQTKTLALEGDLASVELSWGYADSMGLVLTDPGFQRIDPGSPPPNVTYTASITDKTASYLIDSPQPGFWTAEITVTNPYTDGEQYWLTSIVSSTILLETSVDKTLYQPGDPILVQAAISDHSIPITGAIVTATVSLATLQLFDDGSHNDGTANDGLYANVFTDTNQSGKYLFRVEASGTSGSTPFTRLAYTQAEIASREAAFLDLYGEAVIDENADHLYDTLVITTGVQLTSTGSYQIVGALTTMTGTIVANAGAILSDTSGSYQVPLSLDGKLIAQSGLDGPYQLTDLYLIDISTGADIQADYRDMAYTTAAYTASQFQRDFIALGSPITDEGVDTNGNGKYDLLRVQVPINIVNAGVYMVSVNLADSDGNGLTGFTRAYTLTEGVNTLPLDFHGPSISLFQTGGPYDVNGFIISRSPTETLETPHLYATGVYSYSDFEIDAIPPASTINSLPTVITGTPVINVSWTGDDPEPSAGIFFYDVQYRVGSEGTWTDWLNQTLVNSARFGPTDPMTVTSGETYYFQVRATDYAGNQEAYPGGDGDAHTTMVGVDMRTSKSASGQFISGREGSYTIDYLNRGPLPALNVLLTDTLPSGLTYVSDSSGITPTLSGNQIIWNIGTVRAYDHQRFNLTVNISPTLVGGETVTNTLDVSTSSMEHDTTNNSAYATTVIISPTRDMHVSKSLYSGTPFSDGDIEYRIYYQNSGNSDATDVRITDTLPLSTTYVSDHNNYGFTTVVTGNTVVWTKPVVSDGGSGYLCLTVHIDESASVGSTLTNTVRISNSFTETTYANNVYTQTTTVVPHTRDMYVSKYKYSGTAVAGAEIQYRVQFSNQGNSEAANITITDTLPLSTTYVSDNSYGFTTVMTGSTVVWTRDTVAANSSSSIYLAVRVDDDVAGGTLLTNTVRIATSHAETDYSDNVYTYTLTAETPTVDMYVYKSLYSGNTTPGNNLTYRIYYRNDGNTPAANVVITDTLPVSTTYPSFSGPYTPTLLGNQLIWNLGTVPGSGYSGYSGYLYATVHLPEDMPIGTVLTNRVEIATSSPETDYGDNSALDTRTVFAGTPDLYMDKSFQSSYAAQGSEVTYRLYYHNYDYDAALDVTITDTLPLSVTYVSSTGAPEPTVNGNQVVWHLPSLPGSGQTGYYGNIYLTAYISNSVPVGTVLTNTAVITTLNDTNPANNSDTDVHSVVTATRDLYVDKYVNSGSPVIGTDMTYAVRYHNYGNASTANVILTDTLPAGVTLVSTSGAFTPTVNGNVLVWDLGTVPGYSGYQYLYATVHISDTLSPGTSLINQADISTSDTETGTYLNSDADYQTAQEPIPDLYVSKSKYAGTGVAGGTVTYRVYYRNDGSSPTENVAITDTLPTEMTYDPAYSDNDHSGWNRVVNGNQVVWTRPTLNPGQSGYVYVSGRITDTTSVETVLTNTVQIATSSEEAEYSDNEYFYPLTVLSPGCDLQMQKSWSGGKRVPGQLLTYQIDYRNMGAQQANNVVITDTLPPEMSYSSWSYSGYSWSITSSGNVITWTRSYLPSDSSGSIYLTAYISDTLAEEVILTNTVGIGFDSADDDPGDNHHVYPLIISAADRDLHIDKWLSSGDAAPGSQMTYQLYYRNYGTSPASNVIITDTLPVGVGYVSSSEAFTPIVNGNLLTWDLGMVPGQDDSGCEGYLYVTVHVSDTMPIGSYLCNHAEISTSDLETGLERNDDIECRTVQAPSRDMYVSKYVSGLAGAPGGEMAYGIYFHNQGNLTASDVTITDTLPVSTTYVSWSGYAWNPDYTDLDQTITPTVAGNQVVWNLGPVVAGGDGNIYLTVRITDTANVGNVLTNVVRVSTADVDADPNDDIYTNTTSVAPPTQDMYVYKFVAGNGAPGGEMVYGISYWNQGNSMASDVVITDTLPVSVTYVSDHNYDGLPNAVITGSTVVWTRSTVDASSGGYLYVQVRVADTANAGDVLTNVVRVSTSDVDVDSSNNVYTHTATLVSPTQDMQVSKFLSSDPGAPGGEMAYGISYWNQGNSTASDVVITDTLPVGTIYVSDNNFDDLPDAVITGSVVVWTRSTVDAGSGGTMYLQVRVTDTANAGDVLTNVVRVSTSDVDVDSSNNVYTHTATVISPTRDMSVSKFVDDLAGAPGGEMKYRIHFSNWGSPTASNVVITDTLPVSATYVSWHGDAWNPDHIDLDQTITPIVTSDQVVWNLGSVVVGGYGDVYLTVRITDAANIGDVLTNVVRVSTSDVDIDSSNDVYTDTTTVVSPTLNMYVSKWFDSGEVMAGSVVTYGVYVGNYGNVVAADVRLTDTLPVSATYLSSYNETYFPDYALNAFTPTVEGQAVTWQLGDVPGDGYGYFYLTARLTDTVSAGQVLTNIVSVSTSGQETYYGDNSDALGMTAWAADAYEPDGTYTQAQPITTDGALQHHNFHRSNDYDWVRFNGAVGQEYVIETANLGPTVCTEIYLYASDGTTLIASDNDSSGGYASRIVWVATQNDTYYIEVRNLYGFGLNATYDLSVHEHVPTADLAIQKAMSGILRGGGAVNYVLSYHNIGTTAASSVVITDRLPAEMTYSSDTGGGIPDATGKVVTWNLGTLNGGASGSIDVTVHISEGVSAGTWLTNTVEIATLAGEWRYTNNIAHHAGETQTPYGGPDAFGYTFKASNQPGGPTYEWVDILATGTEVWPGQDMDNEYAGPFEIGFTFPFYGNTYSQLYVGSNGYASFGRGYGHAPWGNLPNTSSPNNNIMPFGGDMHHTSGTSHIYYQQLGNPTRFVVQFNSLDCYDPDGHFATFEIILYPDGTILTQYQSVESDYPPEVVGIENADGTIGLDFGTSVSGSLAVRYCPPTALLTDVTVSGPMTGTINTAYTFTATVSPVTATQPITYVWQATGQSPVMHTDSLSDTVAFTWNITGTQAITVTATNAGGTLTDTHAITISAAPPGVVPLSEVTISGPTTGTVNMAYTFIATVSPVTATQPITYVWQATGQALVAHTDGLSDTTTFTWSTPGTQVITLTASNSGGSLVTDTHTTIVVEGISTIVHPTTGSTMVYTDTQGNPTIVQVPAGAVTETITLVYTPVGTVTVPSGFSFAGHAFDLAAYRGGVYLPHFTFQEPVSIILHYSNADVAGLDETSLVLEYWNGSEWVDAATTCTLPSTYDRHPGENWLSVPICHLSRFALFGEAGQHPVYLPLILKNY